MADGEILITVRKNGANRVEVGAPVRIIDEDGNEFIPANRAAKETLLGFLPLATGGFKLAPSVLLKCALPAAVNPPVLLL